MMVLGMACSIAIVFLIANLYIMFTADKTKLKSEFYNTLDTVEIKRYENIIVERRNIYLRGYLLGLLLSILVVSINGKQEKGWFNTAKANICIVGMVTFVVNYLYYIIHPKSDYMVIHLHKSDQRKAWLQINRHMQLKYHVGFVLGIVSAMLMAYSVC